MMNLSLKKRILKDGPLCMTCAWHRQVDMKGNLGRMEDAAKKAIKKFFSCYGILANNIKDIEDEKEYTVTGPWRNPSVD